MSVERLIPVLLHKAGRLVLSRGFEFHQDIGDAYTITDRYKSWDLDELIYLDITPHWQDREAPPAFDAFAQTVRKLSHHCFIPLSAGGGVRTLEQVRTLIHSGADRVVLNTGALIRPALITDVAMALGAQAVIVAMDVRRHPSGDYEVFHSGGRIGTGFTPVAWAQDAQKLGAGEIFLQSIDRDGTGLGYDVNLVRHVASAVSIPVIACGGAGSYADFAAPLAEGAQSVAAANIFAFKELSYYNAKQAMLHADQSVRPARLGMDYTAARAPTDGGSRMGAEKTILWQELDKTGLTG